MESGAELLAPQDKSTARYAKDRTTTKKQRNSLCKEDNWTSLKKTLVNSHYPAVRGQCDEACLELLFDPVPKQTVFNVLQRIGRKRITYDNTFPMKKTALISESHVKYVEDITVKIYTENLGMSRK